jgi:hypothetical protein
MACTRPNSRSPGLVSGSVGLHDPGAAQTGRTVWHAAVGRDRRTQTGSTASVIAFSVSGSSPVEPSRPQAVGRATGVCSTGATGARAMGGAASVCRQARAMVLRASSQQHDG